MEPDSRPHPGPGRERWAALYAAALVAPLALSVLVSKLHKMLTSLDFDVPAFFQPIGPLVEYRLGDTGAIGTSDRCITMSWM